MNDDTSAAGMTDRSMGTHPIQKCGYGAWGGVVGAAPTRVVADRVTRIDPRQDSVKFFPM